MPCSGSSYSDRPTRSVEFCKSEMSATATAHSARQQSLDTNHNTPHDIANSERLLNLDLVLLCRPYVLRPDDAPESFAAYAGIDDGVVHDQDEHIGLSGRESDHARVDDRVHLWEDRGWALVGVDGLGRWIFPRDREDGELFLLLCGRATLLGSSGSGAWRIGCGVQVDGTADGSVDLGLVHVRPWTGKV